MDKYAVEMDNGFKQASKGIRCPFCGKQAERHGAVLKCPVHGTRGFEHDPNPAKETSSPSSHHDVDDSKR